MIKGLEALDNLDQDGVQISDDIEVFYPYTG